ncbi:hypothetical protein PTSG_06663 [Salpingoeca rosetta]|uniref:Alpha/beta hydrolase fold-3 domain-containing protein n=1 Tax=Salpingoeca rosetta (strain ATCC 50818 / BSB-021) TaxID=946362 RepID=F2UFM7_SALR5|nr:uncharacterized protein PTSG_06663 [Salpingoeca rosetta]EGD75595.1 hypothetical protein PTSG_06663 [Salpingoeca rosetta]|eukprot:XP_004992052.1 hypothetical protein PTSG_06663 [Salpingoeca rosetta]
MMQFLLVVVHYLVRLVALYVIVASIHALWNVACRAFAALPRSARCFLLTAFIRFIRWHVDGFWTWVQWKLWLFWPHAHAQDRQQIMKGVASIRWDSYGDREKEMVHVVEPDAEHAQKLSDAPPSKARTILYAHGGGFVFASSSVLMHSITCFCRQGFRVYSMDYPLAPEHRFPAALVSTLRALHWIHAREGVPVVMLLGDSAGGNLVSMAAALIMNPPLMRQFAAAVDEPDLLHYTYPRVESMACLYGLLDQTSWRGRCLKQITRLENFMAEAGISGALELYTNLDGVFNGRYTLMDIHDDIQHFPRTLFVGGSRDPLIYSTLFAHERLHASGFDVHCKIYPARHGFFGFPPQWTFGAWETDAAPTTELLAHFFGQSPTRHRRQCSNTLDGTSCCLAHKADYGEHALRAYDRHFAATGEGW